MTNTSVKYSREAIEKLGYPCQACGDNFNVHLHHIDGNRNNNHISNFQRLCASCHKFLHINKIMPSKITREEKTRKLLQFKKYRNYKKTLKNNIPINFITAKEVCTILGISKQRLSQIKYKFKYIIINKSKKPRYAFQKESIEKYKRKNPTRSSNKKQKCNSCGKLFKLDHPAKKFCSKNCQTQARALIQRRWLENTKARRILV